MDFNVWIQDFLEQYGLISTFFVVMLEYANLPLPSEIVLPFVGFMAAGGNMSLIGAIIVSIIAGIIGSITNYYLGYYFGTPLINILVGKYPKVEKSAKLSYAWLRKHGKASVMFTRIIPLARTFISIPAGITKMNLLVFILYSSIGIGIWNIFLIGLGYVVGDNITIVANILSSYSKTVIIVGLFIAGVIILKIRKLRKKNNIKL